MPPSSSSLSPLQFHSVHGAGIKILKKQGAAKTNEDNSNTTAYGQGFLFSDRSIKVGEKVCLQILELSHNSRIRLGFTKTSPDAFPKSLLGYAKKGATIQNAECWLQDPRTSTVEFRANSKIFYSVAKGGDVILEINGVDKGLIASEVDTSGGNLWAVIDLTGPDVQVQALGIKEVPVIVVTQLPPPPISTPIITPISKDADPSAWNTTTPIQKQKKGPSSTLNARNRSKQPSTLNRFDSFMASDGADRTMEDTTEETSPLNTSKGTSNPRKRSKKKVNQQVKSGSPSLNDEDDSYVGVYIIILMVILAGLALSLFLRK